MRNKISTLYKFNDYLVEAGKGCLWRDKELVALTPKAFETLLVLLRHRGEVVEKDVLLNEIWSDTFVEEATLAQNISTLRRTLGTTADGRQFIETVPRRGYRFVADVKEIVGDEEVFILERRVRTQISAEHETIADEITLRPDAVKTSFSIWQKIKQIRLLAAALIACIVLTGLFFAGRKISQPEKFSVDKFRQFIASKLTSDGKVYKIAVSPDGKYLAYVEKRGELQSLSVRQIDESTAIEIIPPKKQRFLGLTFAPDGKQIYYATYEKENLSTPLLIGNLYRISMLGGVPQLIVSDIDSPIAIAPDNRRFAFVRHHNDDSKIMIAAFDDVKASAQPLAARKISERFSSEGLAWSPDGKTIVCGVYVADSAEKQMDAAFVNAETGEQQLLTRENWSYVGQTSWLADGSAAVFPAFNRKDGQTDDIWLVSYPNGEARQVTNGISGAFGLGLTADSNTLITVKSERLTTFETASATNFSADKNISQNLSEYNPNLPGISWTNNDLILYGSTLNGNQDIWAMKTDGSGKRQLTGDASADYLPVATSDNSFVAFVSNRDGRRNLWLMKSDGSEQRQLTFEGGALSPSISPDNRWIFYSSFDQQTMRSVLNKIPLGGGKPAIVTTRMTYLPKLSPDGKTIACYSPRNADENKPNVALWLTILSAADGGLIKQFDTEMNQEALLPIVWKDNLNITYLTNEDGVSKIWEQSLEGGEPQILLDSPSGNIFRLAWSPDNLKIIYEKGVPINDIILIKSS